MSCSFLARSFALAASCAVLTAFAPHEHGDSQSEFKVEKPVVFLDKAPAIVKFQLGRLSNEQLLLVDRATSHPKFIPVFEAILGRPKMLANFRSESVSALVVLRKTNEPTEILTAIERLDPEKNPGVLPELARLLVTQNTNTLKKVRPMLEQSAGKDSPSSVRSAALAALVTIESAERMWAFVQSEPSGATALIQSLTFVADPIKRAAYYPKLAPFLTSEAISATRAAAINAASRMPGHEMDAFLALTKLIQAGVNAPECARALAQIPKDKWPAEQLPALADGLLAAAKKTPEADRTQNSFLDLQQLAQDIAARLPKENGVAVRKSFAALGVAVLRLRTLHEQMLFDKSLLVVEAGKPFEIVFENTDEMPHNWVLVSPGAADEIGTAAEKMSPTPDALGRVHVPNSQKILQATKMLNAGESLRLRCTAPAKPDKYPYLCTFPGHSLRMRGTLLVVDDLEKYLATTTTEPEPTFTEWKLDDLVPSLAELSKSRDLARGKELFTSTGCISCHRIGKEGVDYGPNLSGVFIKYKNDGKAVLTEIMTPSKNIEPRYRAHSFQPKDGESFTGFILDEKGSDITIQTGPSDALIQKVPKNSIASREAQPLSLMPAGLLNLLSKDQILDLLAYLKSVAR